MRTFTEDTRVMVIDLTEEQTDALLDLIYHMYDNDSLIEETVDLLCSSDEEIKAFTSIDKKDMLRFLLNELADIKHAYLQDV